MDQSKTKNDPTGSGTDVDRADDPFDPSLNRDSFSERADGSLQRLTNEDFRPDQGERAGEDRSYLHFIKEFDKSFLLLLSIQYFNNGMRILAIQSSNYLFKDEYMLTPSRAQDWMVLSNIPWSLKLLYGLVADNLHINGSRKKSFVLIGAIVQFLSLQTLFWFDFTKETSVIVALMLMLINFSQAFMDLIVDTILID